MNILSIDIDYAYSPTISRYDDDVAGSKVPIEEAIAQFGQNGRPTPQVNAEKLQLLKQAVREKTQWDTTVIVAEHHHTILEYLPKDRPFSIVNFDHHHDVYYPGWHSLDKLDEGNWVYFAKNTPIQKYTWIRNKDSEDLSPGIVLGFPFEEITMPNIQDLPSFDLVFACVSSHWTGKTGRKHLFEVLGVER